MHIYLIKLNVDLVLLGHSLVTFITFVLITVSRPLLAVLPVLQGFINIFSLLHQNHDIRTLVDSLFGFRVDFCCYLVFYNCLGPLIV